MKERRKSVISFCSSLVEKRILDESKRRQKSKITSGTDRTFSLLVAVCLFSSLLFYAWQTNILFYVVMHLPASFSRQPYLRMKIKEVMMMSFFSTDLRMTVLFIITVNRIEPEEENSTYSLDSPEWREQEKIQRRDKERTTKCILAFAYLYSEWVSSSSHKVDVGRISTRSKASKGQRRIQKLSRLLIWTKYRLDFQSNRAKTPDVRWKHSGRPSTRSDLLF